MKKQQESPEVGKANQGKNASKEKTLSSGKLNKRLSQRISIEQELKDFDKLKILAIEKINGVWKKAFQRLLNKAILKMIGKSQSQYTKKYGFVMINTLFLAKQRTNKQIGFRGLKQFLKQSNRIKKYSISLARMNKKLQNSRKRQIMEKFQDNVRKQKRNEEEVSSPPKSIGKKPHIPAPNKKEEQISPIYINDSEEDIKSMALSNQMRQVLSELQRYDRVMYLSTVEKSLKNSVEGQLKRLEKIKNSHKQMKNNLYDNEMTIIIISNLLKSVNELIRENRDIITINEENKQLQKRIIQINSQKAQQLRELRESYKAKQNEELIRARLLDGEIKEFNKFSESLAQLFNQSNQGKINKGLEIQMKKLNNQSSKQLSSGKKQILTLFTTLLQHQKTYNTEVDKKNLQIQEITTKLQMIEKSKAQNYKAENQIQSQNSKQVSPRLRQSQKSKQEKDLKKSNLQQWVREWQDIMENMTQRIKRGDQSWIADISKRKKWLSAHKNNQQITRMVNTDITLMNIISGKEKEESYKSSPQRPSFRRSQSMNSQQQKFNKDKLRQLTRENTLLTQQLETVKIRLNVVESQSVSHIEVSNLEQIVYSINQILVNQEKYQINQWSRLRDVLKKGKFEQMNNIGNCLGSLIEMIEAQLNERIELQQKLLTVHDEITTVKASTKAFSLLVQKQLSQESISKMKRNAQSVIRRLDDTTKLNGQLSSLNSLYLEDTKSKLKLLEILQNLTKSLMQLKDDNTQYMLKLNEIETNKELNDKLKVQLNPMSLIDSGKRLNELMKIESSLEEIVQEEGTVDKIKGLQSQRDLLNQQLHRYKQILQRYTSEQKLILQRIEEYEYSLAMEKEKSKALEYQNHQLQAQKRDLSYKFNLVTNEKTVIENTMYKETIQRSHLLEQLEMKEKVIKELSKDITGLDSKVKRLQEQIQKLDIINKQLNQRLMVVDGFNIDLTEKTTEYEQLKKEMARIIRENSIKSTHDEESNIRELQLSNEVEQYRIMIDQLSRKIEETEREKNRIEGKVKEQQQQNQKLLVELQRTLMERQAAFKEYEDIIETSQKEKKSVEQKLREKEIEIKNISKEYAKNSHAVDEYEQKSRESQLKLSKGIDGIVSQRLSSQEQYYKNLLSTNITSYESIIKNQSNEIQRLNKQVADSTIHLATIQQSDLEMSRLKLDIIHLRQAKEEVNKKLADNQLVIVSMLQQQSIYIKEINLLKNKIIQNMTSEQRMNSQLKNQEGYFNEIINENADCYVKNEKSMMDEIQKFREYVVELETLLKQRELAVINQSHQLENKNYEVDKMKGQISGKKANQDNVQKEVEKLKEELRMKQVSEEEDAKIRTKMTYLQQNQSLLRSQIDRLVQENKLLIKERQRTKKYDDSQLLAENMRSQLQQLESMLNKLREEKERSISNMKNEVQGLNIKCRQRQIQLIQQQRYTTGLISKFEEREQELIDKINATDTVNRELSDHLEIVTNQYNNLKTLIHENKRLEKSSLKVNELGGEQISLTEKLKLLSLSSNVDKNKEYLPNIKVRTQEGESLHPYVLAESKAIQLGFSEDPSNLRSLSADQRYLQMSQANSSLLLRLDSLQSKLHNKEMQLMKMTENCQYLQQQNKKLISELKNISEKAFASQAKNVLRIQSNGSNNQLDALQSQIEKIKSENTFLKYKSSYLQNQLRAEKNSQMNKSISMRGLSKSESKRFLLKQDGGKMTKNITSVQKTNHELAHKLNSIISNNQEATEQDLLQITILKKISDQVGDLVDSNTKLMQKLKTAEKENETLYETINRLTQNNPRQGKDNIKILMPLHKMILSLVEWLSSEDVVTQQDINFSQFEQRLQSNLKKNTPLKYIETMEELIKTVIATILNSRQELLSGQAQQLIQMRQKLSELVNLQIQQAESSEYNGQNGEQKLNQVDFLLKAYSKSRNPKIINDAGKLLHKRKKNSYK